MRITPTQLQTIHQQIHHYFGDSATVWVFGSRLDDTQKGGDVDLYVEAGPHRLLDELRCKIGLEERLEIPVDLIVRQSSDTSPIAVVANKQGAQIVSEAIQLIRKKIEHLHRMKVYLDYSLAQTLPVMPITNWTALTPEQHETLAAFRVRFSDFQERLGKTMRAIAREEEQSTEPFSAVLIYMTKLGILDSVEQWKLILELRNAVNHEYEENTQRLSEFFRDLTQATPALYLWLGRIVVFCKSTYSQ